MARVFWDSNLFIYLFEANPLWSPRVVDLRSRMLKRRDELFTSYLTVGEILTKPRASGNAILEKSYQTFFESDELRLLAFDMKSAQRYAAIRSRNRVRPADAIQLACAAAAGTDLFITNDTRLADLVVDGITFITGIEHLPY